MRLVLPIVLALFLSGCFKVEVESQVNIYQGGAAKAAAATAGWHHRGGRTYVNKYEAITMIRAKVPQKHIFGHRKYLEGVCYEHNPRNGEYYVTCSTRGILDSSGAGEMLRVREAPKNFCGLVVQVHFVGMRPVCHNNRSVTVGAEYRRH